jgi:hypothetical protein
VIVDPRAADPAPFRQYPDYAEDGCGRGARLWSVLVLPGALFVVAVVCLTDGAVMPAVLVLILFVLCGLIAGIGLMTRLPLGIRLDEHGVSIGGVRFSERHRRLVRRRDKPLQGFTRALHAYSCAWPGVRRLTVVSGRPNIQLISRKWGRLAPNAPWWAEQGFTPWAPGKFLSPAAKALLVIEVETRQADFQELRPPKGRVGRDMAARIYGGETMTWIIPTRHPDQLLQAIRATDPPQSEI